MEELKTIEEKTEELKALIGEKNPQSTGDMDDNSDIEADPLVIEKDY